MDYGAVVVGSDEKYYHSETADHSEVLEPSGYTNSGYLQNLAEIEVRTTASGIPGSGLVPVGASGAITIGAFG